MDNVSPAEYLPTLYRAILDGIAELERIGERREAARVRSEAIRVYSQSWDDRNRQRLEVILRRAQRVAASNQATVARDVRQPVATTT